MSFGWISPAIPFTIPAATSAAALSLAKSATLEASEKPFNVPSALIGRPAASSARAVSAIISWRVIGDEGLKRLPPVPFILALHPE
ncbi:hypothetical protein L1N85_21080 [Paenibacillus alkaliterrae]|nr:hypothetical protein [Paenibacillus alkaliterrae]MCF2940886.1 hypothetical protein [Paenibacillus alkaliterrae]